VPLLPRRKGGKKTALGCQKKKTKKKKGERNREIVREYRYTQTLGLARAEEKTRGKKFSRDKVREKNKTILVDQKSKRVTDTLGLPGQE